MFINYKMLKPFVSNNRVSMVEIVQFVFVVIIFLSLFLVLTKVEGKTYLSFSIFLLCFVKKILN